MNAEALIGTVLGTCTLQKLLGQGGMGAVYLAQQSRPRRQVAVKVLLPMTPLSPNQLAAFLERFRRETDAAASLEHPNIMPVHEYGEREGLAYLVMPFISGGTLRDLLEREGQLSFKNTVYFLDQMAAAIDCAHEHGVIHRDIKPANILIKPEGRLLLTDFGLVKIVAERQAQQLRLTGPGAPVGTPDYMAPEQVIGEEVDTRADIYSLGIILYQMVTGTTPFQGEAPMQIAAQHLQLPPPSPKTLRPDLPDEAVRVILKALEKRPENRQAHAQDLALGFKMALVKAGVLADTSAIATVPRMPLRTATAARRMIAPMEKPDPAWPPFESGDIRQKANGEGGLLRKTGMLPTVTSNLPTVRGGGLLSRTGMMPAIGKNVDSSEHMAHTVTGGLLSRTGRFPRIGTGTLPAASNKATPPAEGVLATAVPLPPLSPPEIVRNTGALDNRKQDSNGSKKLSGPVKVVKVPVSGQPGRFVTGLLPVAPPEEPGFPFAPEIDSKKRRNKLIKIVAAILIVLLIIGGLGAVLFMNMQARSLSSNGAPAAKQINPSSARATATAQANILLSDPLNQPVNNWLTTPADTFAFKDGTYHITDHGNQGRASILQGHTFNTPNMTYTLTMQEVKGNDGAGNNTFGMVFRFNQKTVNNKTATTFYSFEIENTNGGNYHFWKYDDTNTNGANAWTDLWHTKYGKEFHQGHGPQATNTINVIMQGGNFTFVVNGKQVGTAKKNALTAGMIGMIVNLDGTEVAFKNLLVTLR